MLSPQEINKLTDAEIDRIPVAERIKIGQYLEQCRNQLRQENALLYYKPVGEEAKRFHLSDKRKRPIVGGNGSSKSETQLVDIVIEMTGIIPLSLKDIYPKERLRPPIAARLIVKSLTNTWEAVIKPKLIYDHWTGLKDGVRGHFGWIPKHMLIKGKWEESWSEKYRTCTLTNGSTLQIMSHDQDLTDFSGASIHRIGVDEGPKAAVWRENVMRMREGGSISIVMTPPDDVSASWDAAWVFELYESGLPGPNQAPDVESFTLFSEDNPYTDKQALADMVRDLTEAQKEVSMHGHFMHLSGRIYPTYSDRPKQWCLQCGKPTLVFEGKQCSACKSENIVAYCHLIEPFPQAFTWPCIMAIDPHPRKPHCVAWWTISPSDDIYQVAEIEVDDTPGNVKKAVDKLENSLRLRVSRKLMDPNMGESPSTTSAIRHETVKETFDRAGLRCAMADDNRTTAQMKIKEFLKVDSRTMQPRLHIFNTCKKTNYQMLHYSWGEWARYTSDSRDPKPIPKDKDSDFPTLLGYMMNDNPTYRSLQGSVNILRTPAASNRQKYMEKRNQHKEAIHA